MDDKKTQFLEFTSGTPEQAAHFLEMGDGNLERAISLFFEHDGAIGVTDDLLAFEDVEEYRAPIPQIDDRIHDYGTEEDSSDRRARIEADLQAMDDRLNDPSFNERVNLQWSPPSYNDRRTLQEVRKDAEDVNRWLIVNIQDYQNLQSRELNRSVFNDEDVSDVIINNYLFWQRDDQSVEGSQMMTLYKLNKSRLPLILFLHPMTGRCMVQLEYEEFKTHPIEVLLNYIESHGAPVPEPRGSLMPTNPPQSQVSLPAHQFESSQLPSNPGSAETPGPSVISTPAKPVKVNWDIPADAPQGVISLVFPDGSREKQKFLDGHLIADLTNYVSQYLQVEPSRILCQTRFPRKVLAPEMSVRDFFNDTITITLLDD